MLSNLNTLYSQHGSNSNDLACKKQHILALFYISSLQLQKRSRQVVDTVFQTDVDPNSHLSFSSLIAQTTIKARTSHSNTHKHLSHKTVKLQIPKVKRIITIHTTNFANSNSSYQETPQPSNTYANKKANKQPKWVFTKNIKGSTFTT